MKALAALCLSLSLLLSGCSKTVVLHAQDADILVSSKPCSNPAVKAFLEDQATMALDNGMDAAVVKQMIDSFKDATVVVTADEDKGKTIAACVADQGNRWFVVDERGGFGPLPKAEKKD